MNRKFRWFDDDFEDEFNEAGYILDKYMKRKEVNPYVVATRGTSLPHPHYTNDYFKTARTVYGKEEKGLGYDYSDRIWQWDYDKAKAATEVANESGKTKNSVNWYEVYLSAYFDKPVELKHVLAGFNVATGYPYYVFGYRFKEVEK